MSGKTEEIVRAAVEQALQRQLASLRENIVQEVLREVGSGSGEASTGVSAAALQKAISGIQSGATQKEILRALLDSATIASGRAALFVVKGGAATGWQGAGFANNDAIKDCAFDLSSGMAAAAIQSRSAQSGNAGQVDKSFTKKFGAPGDGNAAVLPLLLKDKVSALLYADAGDAGTLDVAALDVLVRATSSWLEVISQRKQAQKEGGETMSVAQPSPANDPFAAHAPIHSAKAQHVAEAAPMAMSAAASGSGAVSIPAGEAGEVHRKAQRFARLLMDEIKLYNQAKVAEGRKHKDLYDRLKEDIEKSRATYQKRYGNTPAASADYFSQELIRSLAEDDASLMGSNFRR